MSNGKTSLAICAAISLAASLTGCASRDTERLRDALIIDSLQRSIIRWELYSENLRRIIDGIEPISLDSLAVLAEERWEQERLTDPAEEDILK